MSLVRARETPGRGGIGGRKDGIVSGDSERHVVRKVRRPRHSGDLERAQGGERGAEGARGQDPRGVAHAGQAQVRERREVRARFGLCLRVGEWERRG